MKQSRSNFGVLKSEMYYTYQQQPVFCYPFFSLEIDNEIFIIVRQYSAAVLFHFSVVSKVLNLRNFAFTKTPYNGRKKQKKLLHCSKKRGKMEIL